MIPFIILENAKYSDRKQFFSFPVAEGGGNISLLQECMGKLVVCKDILYLYYDGVSWIYAYAKTNQIIHI